MTDLLLTFYNKEDSNAEVLLDNLAPVIELLVGWRRRGILDAQSLLNFMIDQVVGVVTEVRNKLLHRASYKFEIVSFDRPDEDEPTAPDEDGFTVSDYRDAPCRFDRFIYTMWKYLEMLTRTSPFIEDLFLALLEVLELPQPNKFTVFHAVHWQAFRNVILKDSVIRAVIAQIDLYRDSGYAENNPALYLDRVRAIRGKMSQVSAPYGEYLSK